MLYLANAFSLQMLNNLRTTLNLEVTPITKEMVIEVLKNNRFVSCVGHIDTANVLSQELGLTIEMNRINVSLNKDDTLIVAQLVGGRLPEGSTSLPENFSFKFFVVNLSRKKKKKNKE